MPRRPRGAEVIGNRADRQDEIVVPQAMPPHDLDAVLSHHRRQADLPLGAVYAFQRALEEAIAPAMAMAAVADLVEVRIQRAGGDLMEQRLPDVGRVPLHQDDVVVFAAETSAETPHELQ